MANSASRAVSFLRFRSTPLPSPLPRMDRFFHPDLSPSSFELLEGEAHHLARVLRKAAGESVEVFDGAGGSTVARIADVSKRRVLLERLTEVKVDLVPACRTRVACAVPKGDRFKWIVEKLTEIGTDELQLLTTERSVVEPGEAKRERLEQHVLSACKQCGRNRVLTIHPPVEWTIFARQESGVLFLADRAGAASASAATVPREGTVTVAIGPEGGWTDSERAIARERNAQAVAFGEYILRVETAAIIGGAWLERLRSSAPAQ